MKNLLQKIFLGAIAVLIIILGGSIFSEFMANHTYYKDMFASRKNWKLIIGALISAGVPVFYLIKNKTFSLKKFIIWLFAGLLLFSFIHVIVNDSFVSKGMFLYIINILLLFVLGSYFLTGILAFGTWISSFIKFKENRIQEMLLKFGIGLGALLILVDILIGFNIFHPIVAWIMFLGLGFMIRYMRIEMKHFGSLISEMFASFKSENLRKNRWKWLLVVLFLFSVVYYFYGFQLSFIPYSTAWDANHAYMYTPKIIAENFGLIWGNVGTAGAMPYLWYAFITFWFSLGSIFSGGWLSPDTIAVSMNFLSGPLCLIFGVALIKEIIGYFSEKIKLSETTENLTFGTGWMMLLLRLCSGMGAFLVFVDNKTDLGVMALTILAMLSGFIFIRYISEHKSKKLLDKDSLKYLITSGLMFAFASMAKPSAFIDVVIFGLILVSLWINEIIALGLGISLVGLMGIMHVQNAADFMTVGTGKVFFVIGILVVLLGIVLMFLRHRKEINEKKSLLSYICIWGVSIFAALVVFKGPWLAYGQHLNGGFNIVDWGKGLFLSMDVKTDDSVLDHSKLYATTADIDTINDQNAVDKALLGDTAEVDAIDTQVSVSNDLSLEQCLSMSYTEDELKEGMLEAEVTNEDVGRYVGYGWKTFGDSTKGITYSLLKLFYGKDGKCYGFDKDAKILCEHQSEIAAGNIDAIKSLKLKEGSVAGNLLEEGLANYEENADTLMDLVSNLKTYYQNNSIYRNNGLIYVPYRYIIPLNITFNWSLQNLSSYYTDIGFIWIFAFLFLVLSLIYSLCKKDNKLISLSVSTIIGWAIWWVIGGGILWYGIGLVMWTILVMIVFCQDLLSAQKDDWHKIFYIIVFALLGVWMAMQMFFNLIRISSQGSSGPFLWFKQSAGTAQNITDNLGVENNVKVLYGQKDVFNLQFPHYNKFIEYVKDRADNDGVLVAGTYIQYFLDNQKNIFFDGSLNRFWEQGSDENACKMYHRLRNNNIKYMVIDPNIASIVMGEGNKSLFYRFFAKIDDNGKMISKGAMFMLTQLIDEGYMKLLYSNNLGSKYAYTLSDDELISMFGSMTKDDLIYLRSQMSAARYMSNANELVNYIATILNSRIANGLAIGDIADVYGKIVDEEKIINTVNVYLSNPSSLPTMVATLDQDERFVLLQYLNFYSVLKQGNTSSYNEMLNSLLSSSLAGGSQLMVFELR